MSLSTALKTGAGRALAMAAPQCRYERCIFLIGHMRCGSTALSNVIASSNDISGYGETHVVYENAAGPGVLALNQAKKRAWKLGAPFLFDKVLHNTLDRRPPHSFFAARAIFMIRNPNQAAPSIVRLFKKVGSHEYRSLDSAALYYRDRVMRMTELWRQFPASRRIAINFEDMIEAPDRLLNRLSRFLSLSAPLANHYAPNSLGVAPGAGDPVDAGRYARIVHGGVRKTFAIEMSASEEKALIGAKKAYEYAREVFFGAQSIASPLS